MKILKSLLLVAVFATLINCSKPDTITSSEESNFSISEESFEIASPEEVEIKKPSKSTIIYQPGSSVSNTVFNFADVNGDEKADKIYWNYSQNEGQVMIYLATSGGYFSTTPIITPGSGSSNTRLYFKDVNGDGLADRIYWNYSLSSGNVMVYLATGGGYFSSTPIVTPGSGSSNTILYFEDVNGDGKADRIYWNYSLSNGNLRVYLATSGGYFSTTVAESYGSSKSSTRFYFADVNGDGKADKILWNTIYNNGATSVFLATSNGYFSTNYICSNGSTSEDVRFYFADFTGDNKADKVIWQPGYIEREVNLYPMVWQERLYNAMYVYASSTTSFYSDLFTYIHTYYPQSNYANPSIPLPSPYPFYPNIYFADVDGDGSTERILWHADYHGGDLEVMVSY